MPRSRRRALALAMSHDPLAAEPLENLLQLLLARRLRLDPVADHLLLGAHVLHEPLDALGEIGHGLRGGAPAGAVIDGGRELVEGYHQIAGLRDRRRRHARRVFGWRA